MRQGYNFLYVLIFFIFISFILRVFWPVLLALAIAAFIYYLYITYKINKELNKQSQQISEQSNYNEWVNQTENIKQKDVIDVEYTEHKEQ